MHGPRRSDRSSCGNSIADAGMWRGLTLPPAFGDLDLFTFVPIMECNDSSRSLVRSIETDSLASSYRYVLVVVVAVAFEFLVVTGFVVDSNGRHLLNDTVGQKCVQYFFDIVLMDIRRGASPCSLNMFYLVELLQSIFIFISYTSSLIPQGHVRT